MCLRAARRGVRQDKLEILSGLGLSCSLGNWPLAPLRGCAIGLTGQRQLATAGPVVAESRIGSLRKWAGTIASGYRG